MFKCPICNKNILLKKDVISHVEKEHGDQIPTDLEGGTAQFIYMNNHDGRKYGLCRICGKPTKWNMKTARPCLLCTDPKCIAKNKEIAEERMLRIYGKTSLMEDPKHIEKMLAARKISGVYNWSDGIHKFVYTGNYERFVIEWLDKVMNIDPDTVQMPGLIIVYDLDGKPANWITDLYLPDFNLIVEVKDGKEENTGANFSGTRHREHCKDEFMKHQNQFNYVKVTHKNVMQLVRAMTTIKESGVLDDEKHQQKAPVIQINE